MGSEAISTWGRLADIILRDLESGSGDWGTERDRRGYPASVLLGTRDRSPDSLGMKGTRVLRGSRDGLGAQQYLDNQDGLDSQVFLLFLEYQQCLVFQVFQRFREFLVSNKCSTAHHFWAFLDSWVFWVFLQDEVMCLRVGPVFWGTNHNSVGRPDKSGLARLDIREAIEDCLQGRSGNRYLGR